MALTSRLRPATAADAEALAAIELESFPDPSWSDRDFLRYDCVVAEVAVDGSTTVAGFLVSREIFAGTSTTPPEREILNLAVTPGFRRYRLATGLLEYELKRGAVIFLEVRETNTAAIQLYRNAGFIEISKRLDYYENPAESAIVMRMKW